MIEAVTLAYGGAGDDGSGADSACSSSPSSLSRAAVFVLNGKASDLGRSLGSMRPVLSILSSSVWSSCVSVHGTARVARWRPRRSDTDPAIVVAVAGKGHVKFREFALRKLTQKKSRANPYFSIRFYLFHVNEL
jgi:hypothetical protein